MGTVEHMTGLSDLERLANFLALTHCDCDIGSLPERAPPLSGQATQQMYRDEAAAILKLLHRD